MSQTPARRSTPLNDLTASEIAVAVHKGETTCEAVVRACLERIDARESEVEAWQYLNQRQVIDAARAIDRAGPKGPLAGVPFGMKDIIDTIDMPTEYGSPIYRGHQPKSDAACVALSRRAGGILLGKTVTTEFANRFPGKTRNPFDRARTPGGSSSGSAAAVGDHMVPLAVGTQTTASTIRPASFCGVFGYRPTHGDLRCVGVKEASGSLDTLGLFARSIEDIARYRDVLLGIEPQPIPALDKPRIGFCRSHLWSEVEPATQNLFEHAARALSRAGAGVRDVELPKDFERIPHAHRWISSFEFSRNFTWEIENHWDEISEELRSGRLKDGLGCSFDTYVEARTFAERCRAWLGSIWSDYDVLLTAPATGEAPVGIHSTGNASLCSIWTAMHVPAVTMPAFKGPNGLPIGAQLIGERNGDRKVFAAVRWAYDVLAQK